METNTSNAIFIGVSTFIFVAAISTTLILLSIVEDMSKVSLERMGDIDPTVLKVDDDINSNVITGYEVLTYYSNYIMPQNENFVFKQCSDASFRSCSDVKEPFFKDRLDKYFIKYVSTTKNAQGEEIPLVRFVYCSDTYKNCSELEYNNTK